MDVAVEVRHEPWPWNGGWKCNRCGRRVAPGRAPAGADACDPVPWAPGTFELLHRAGPSTNGKGDRLCLRCGDPAPMSIENGEDYVLTDANEVAGEHRSVHSWSVSVGATLSSINASPCDGSWSRGL